MLDIDDIVWVGIANSPRTYTPPDGEGYGGHSRITEMAMADQFFKPMGYPGLRENRYVGEHNPWIEFAGLFKKTELYKALHAELAPKGEIYGTR